MGHKHIEYVIVPSVLYFGVQHFSFPRKYRIVLHRAMRFKRLSGRWLLHLVLLVRSSGQITYLPIQKNGNTSNMKHGEAYVVQLSTAHFFLTLCQF